MRTERLPLLALVSMLAPLGLAGCDDVGNFSTAEDEIWRGAVVDAEIVRKGFEPGTTLEMTFDSDALDEAPGTLTTLSPGGDTITVFDHALLVPIGSLKHDSLSGFDFPSGRLKSYMFFTPAGDPFGGMLALVVVSLLTDGDMEVRIILGGENLYGIFTLQKQLLGD